MTPGGWWWLLWRDVFAQRGRLALLLFCLTLTATLFGITLTVLVFLRSELRPQLRELFPERRVVVRPATTDLLFFRMEGRKLGPEDVETFRAMPEVAAIYPQVSAAFPVSADFQMETVGAGFITDVILFGAPKELIAAELAVDVPFPPDDEEALVPVLISEYFLDAYNLGLAESAGMPKLSRSAILGVEFDLLLGDSITGLGQRRDDSMRRRARIVGLTRQPLLFGITAPADMVREWNRVYTPERADETAILHMDLASPEDAEAVRAVARERQLRFEAQRDVLARYLRVVATIEALLAGGFLVVAGIALVGVVTTVGAVVAERRPAWGLHRATGLGRRGVLLLATGHGVAAGLPSGLLAAGLVYTAFELLHARLGDFAEVSFLPLAAVVPGAAELGAIVGLAVVFAVLPTLFFTIPILFARPVSLLAERSL